MAYPTKHYRAQARLNVQRSKVQGGMNLEGVQEAMGTMATEKEAQAMLDLLEEQGYHSVDEVEDSTWFELLRKAIKK